MSAPEPVSEQPALQIEAEDDQTDDGSSISGGSITDGSLASLQSSIRNYRVENGRTYHRMSDGKYLLPNDEREKDRLDITHHLWRVTWEGDLCNSPKRDGAGRVLDIGTGTGIWAMDYAEEHPEAIVTGVDLSPIQPEFVPPNCSFEVDDVEKEWTWSQPFDFIFVRCAVGSFSSWEDMIAKAYENLEPGGYIEIQDNDFPLKCGDDTMTDGCKTYKWIQLLIEACEKLGRPVSVVPRFKQMLLDAGFVDVVEKKAIWPMNPWPKDKKLKEVGTWSRESTLQGLEGLSLGLFTRVLGWSPEETNVLCAEVRNEITKLGVHGYYDVYSVWGRKPEKEGSKAPAA